MIAERLKALETMVEILRADVHVNFAEIKKEIVNVKMAAQELHYSIYGGPKSNDVGLQEKLRKARWIERAVFTTICAVVVFLGNLIKPVYEKAITDWAFFSPSEKWAREQKRPKIIRKTYVIRRQAPPPEPPSEDEEPQQQ